MEAESSTMGAARTTRARKKRKSYVPSASDPEDGYQDSKQIVRKPSKKRYKPGRLADLMDLPIDVLFEIFGHLKPYDLLKLARMTKEFRRLLMHKSSKSVWKEALERVPDLPVCPPEMSEPAWVNLVFDPHCHFCFTNGVRDAEWTLRVRICSKCAKEQIDEVYMPDILPAGSMEFFSCYTLVASRLGKRGRRGILLSDYEKVKQEFEAIEGADARSAYILERRKIISEIEQHASLCSAWALGQKSDRSYELQEARNERRLAIIEKLTALGYADDVAGIRFPDALEDHELVKKPKKLTDRIWKNIEGPILEFMNSMRVKRLAREHAQLVLERKPSAISVFRTYKNQQLPLTEIMPEGLDICDFPPVKAILEQPSDVTIDESSFSEVLPLIADLIVEWRKSLDDELIRVMKRAHDMIQMRKADMIMAALIWNRYNEYDIDEDDFTPEPPLDEATLPDNLMLATTVFQCTSCTHSGYGSEDDSSSDTGYGMSDDSFFGNSYASVNVSPLFYPKVMGHPCLTRKKPSLWSWGPAPEPARKLENSSKTRRKWTAHALRVDRRLGRCVEALITKAGLDPETTTADDMDNLETWFACLRCGYPTEKEKKKKGPFELTAFMWRDAVKHFGVRHPRTEPLWKKVDGEEIEQARQEYETRSLRREEPMSRYIMEAAAVAADDNPPDPSWLCVHCRDTPSEVDATGLGEIKTHLFEKHGIQDAEVDRDYYKDYAALRPFPPQCRIVIDLDNAERKLAVSY